MTMATIGSNNNQPLKKELHLDIEFQKTARQRQAWKANHHVEINFPFKEDLPTPESTDDEPEKKEPLTCAQDLGFEREKFPDGWSNEVIENEDGTSAETTYDENCNPIKRTFFDENGAKKAEMKFGDETDEITTISYGVKTVQIMNKEGQPLKETKYDLRTNSVLRRSTFDNGNLTCQTKFDPSTGDIIAKSTYTYNEKGLVEIVHQEYKEDGSIGSITKHEYNEDGQKTKTHYQGYNMHYEEIFDHGELVQMTFYDEDGNIEESIEFIKDHPIHPVATEIFNGASDETKSKIDDTNIFDILNAFKVKYPDKNIIETILANDNIKDKNAFITHLIRMSEDAAESNANIALHNDSNEVICDGIAKTSARIDANSPPEQIMKTLDLMQSMSRYQDFFIDKANGKVDKITYQSQSVGDCWMLAGISALSLSPAGQKMLENCLEIDNNTGNVTVKLQGGKKAYTFTPDELREATHLSRGDYDVRAIELAVEKYFKEKKPDGRSDINGNTMEKFYEILTGNSSTTINEPELLPILKEVALASGLDIYNRPMSVPSEYWESEVNGKTVWSMIEELQPDIAMTCGALTDPMSGHAYTVKKIEGGKIYITEPHNTSNEVVFTKEEFMRNFDELVFMVLSDEK
jgi:hypothetical protein